jgi:hypothetical protein
MRSFFLHLCLLFFPLVTIAQSYDIHLIGKIKNSQDQSASTFVDGKFLILGGDEDNDLQVLTQESTHSYKVIQNISLNEKLYKGEIDVEGLTSISNDVFVIGSHSMVRKKVSSANTLDDNLKKIEFVKDGSSRRSIFRFKIDMQSGLPVTKIEEESIWPLLIDNPILKRFTQIPSKENGIDIEGMSIDKNRNIYIGLRGPVLRGNHAIIIVINENELFSGKAHKDYSLRFINLNGFGIRGMTNVKDGFLVLAGPVSGLRMDHKIYFWNGESTIPSSSLSNKYILKELFSLKSPASSPFGNGESLSLIKENSENYELLVTFDNAKNGAPQKLTLKK